MIRFRLAAALLALAAAAMGLAIRAPEALAAAEIHRLNLVLSAIPTSVDGGDFNKDLDAFNRAYLVGLEGLNKVSFAWLFESQLRYFVRPNIAVNAGLGQIRAVTRREYLPALQSSVVLEGEILSVPLNLGAAYYLQPYNQGDFQARFFFGGGLSSLVHNKAQFKIARTAPNVTIPPYDRMETRDSPGWYTEAGVHMFFAARYSVIITGIYRNARINEMVDSQTRQPWRPVPTPESNQPFALDMSGVGLRGGLCLGF